MIIAQDSEAYTHLLYQLAGPDSGVNKDALSQVIVIV